MVSSPTIPVVLYQSRFRRWRDRDLDILVEVDPNPSTFPDYYVPPITLEQRTYVHDSHHDSHAAANRSSDSGALQPVGDGSHGGPQNGEPERSGDHDCFPTTVRKAQTVLFDPPVERNRAAVRKNNMVEDQLQAGRDLLLLVCRAGGCDGAVQPCALRESKFSIDGQRAKDVRFHSVALARRLATPSKRARSVSPARSVSDWGKAKLRESEPSVRTMHAAATGVPRSARVLAGSCGRIP